MLVYATFVFVSQVFSQRKVEGSNLITVLFIIIIIIIIIISFIFLDVMYAHIHKPRVPVFQHDKVLKSYEHTTVRLPSHLTMLN